MSWPEGFSDIGGRSFEWVYQNKGEWVLFTLEEMTNPTGLFKQWQEFCRKKVNNACRSPIDRDKTSDATPVADSS